MHATLTLPKKHSLPVLPFSGIHATPATQQTRFQGHGACRIQDGVGRARNPTVDVSEWDAIVLDVRGDLGEELGDESKIGSFDGP